MQLPFRFAYKLIKPKPVQQKYYWKKKHELYGIEQHLILFFALAKLHKKSKHASKSFNYKVSSSDNINNIEISSDLKRDELPKELLKKWKSSAKCRQTTKNTNNFVSVQPYTHLGITQISLTVYSRALAQLIFPKTSKYYNHTSQLSTFTLYS